MDHVRHHLDDDLSLERLAGLAAFSPFHFHRIFRSVCGQTPVAFVQRARLERAAYLMKTSPERSLTSIAMEVGFSASSDFSRVFRSHYGIAPSDWDRKSRLEPEEMPGYDEAVRTARAAGPAPEARVVDHPAVRLAYVRVRAPFVTDALPRGYERLTSWLQERGVDWRVRPLLGMSWDNYETTPLDQVRFDLGFSVPDEITPADEVGIHEFPALRSVDVHCRGEMMRIAVAWDYLYEEWLPGSGWEPDDLPPMKRFRRRPDEMGGWEHWDVDCSIPIRSERP